MLQGWFVDTDGIYRMYVDNGVIAQCEYHDMDKVARCRDWRSPEWRKIMLPSYWLDKHVFPSHVENGLFCVYPLEYGVAGVNLYLRRLEPPKDVPAYDKGEMTMFRFDERIEALKQRARQKGRRSAILNDALALIDEMHRAYQAAWADECNATMALEGRDEQIARLQSIRQDSFDIDPNNGD